MFVLAFGTAQAQLIVEDFDSQTTGSPPAWSWWTNGPSGTILVDETIFRGSSGKSVELVRTTFDNYIVGLYEKGLITEETAMAYASRKSFAGRGIDSVKSKRGEATTDIETLEIDTRYDKAADQR